MSNPTQWWQEPTEPLEQARRLLLSLPSPDSPHEIAQRVELLLLLSIAESLAS